ERAIISSISDSRCRQGSVVVGGEARSTLAHPSAPRARPQARRQRLSRLAYLILSGPHTTMTERLLPAPTAEDELDQAAIRRLVGGNEELLREILELFVTELPAALAEVG